MRRRSRRFNNMAVGTNYRYAIAMQRPERDGAYSDTRSTETPPDTCRTCGVRVCCSSAHA